MNLKRIIQEALEDFDWIKDTIEGPLPKLEVGNEYEVLQNVSTLRAGETFVVMDRSEDEHGEWVKLWVNNSEPVRYRYHVINSEIPNKIRPIGWNPDGFPRRDDRDPLTWVKESQDFDWIDDVDPNIVTIENLRRILNPNQFRVFDMGEEFNEPDYEGRIQFDSVINDPNIIPIRLSIKRNTTWQELLAKINSRIRHFRVRMHITEDLLRDHYDLQRIVFNIVEDLRESLNENRDDFDWIRDTKVKTDRDSPEVYEQYYDFEYNPDPKTIKVGDLLRKYNGHVIYRVEDIVEDPSQSLVYLNKKKVDDNKNIAFVVRNLSTDKKGLIRPYKIMGILSSTREYVYRRTKFYRLNPK